MPAQPEPCVHVCECLVCQARTDGNLMHRHQQINLFLSRLTEPQRRWYVGMLSDDPATPSDVELARITGLDRKTIRCGRRELDQGLANVVSARQRGPGAGQPAAEKKTRTS